MPLTTYNTGGSLSYTPDAGTPENTNKPYLVWLHYVLGQSDADVPRVISTSLGENEQTVPQPYTQTVCAQSAQLVARGISLSFVSGDNGVGPNGTCVTDDGKDTPALLPAFPASCPFVTAVGGTQNSQPEIAGFNADNALARSGSFSNYFARPSDQDSAIKSYLDILSDQSAGLFNRSDRGYTESQLQATTTSMCGMTCSTRSMGDQCCFADGCHGPIPRQ